MTPRLTVSIVNYRTAELTLSCIGSVLADLGTLPAAWRDRAQVIVVDNNSGDGSADRIGEWIERNPDAPVSLIRSAVNTGFSGGHNQALAAAPGAFTLLLNSDADLRPGALAALLAAAAASPEAGLLAPRLEWEDGTAQESCFRFAGPASEFIRGAQIGPVTRLLRSRQVALGIDPEPGQIGWASFACILLRRATVDAIGPMDEGYFLYFEDAEFCLRARRAGWRVAFVPQARVVHHRGGSGPVKSLSAARARLPAYFYASRSRFLFQAHGRFGLWSANLLWCAGQALGQLKPLFGKPRARCARAEWRDIWTNVFDPSGPRHAPEE